MPLSSERWKARLNLARESFLHLSSEEVAYIAGIIDGEGSIGIYDITTNKKGKRWHSVLVRITIANTCKDLFEWLIPRLPGCRVYWQAQTRKPNHRMCGRLTLDGTKGIALCERLIPYLNIKRKQAEIAVRFYSEGNWTPGTRVSKEEWGRREALRQEFAEVMSKRTDRPLAGRMIH